MLALVPRLREFGPPPWRTVAELDAGELRVLRQAFEQLDGGGLSGDQLLLIAEVPAGEPAGFLHATTTTDFFTGRPQGHISTIATASHRAGLGVGQALLDAVEAWAHAREYATLELNVFEQNQRARHVYEHAGFRVETLRYVKPLEPRPSGTPDEAE